MAKKPYNLGEFLGVQNMQTPAGNDAPNQFILNYKNGQVFQSYKSIIAVINGNQTFIGQDWDYSVTTGKYRNIFLREDKKETQRKINSGEYILINK